MVKVVFEDSVDAWNDTLYNTEGVQIIAGVGTVPDHSHATERDLNKKIVPVDLSILKEKKTKQKKRYKAGVFLHTSGRYSSCWSYALLQTYVNLKGTNIY